MSKIKGFFGKIKENIVNTAKGICGKIRAAFGWLKRNGKKIAICILVAATTTAAGYFGYGYLKNYGEAEAEKYSENEALAAAEETVEPVEPVEEACSTAQ